MMRTALLVALLLLAGCSMTLPVRGVVSGADETFSGTATGNITGSGTLNVITTSGAHCSGDFVYVNNRQGEGVFICNDGRSGPFTFVSTGTRGNGRGQLDGKPFTFTFGK